MKEFEKFSKIFSSEPNQPGKLKTYVEASSGSVESKRKSWPPRVGILYRDIYSKSFKKNSSQKYFFSEVNKPGKLTLVWDLVVLHQNCESHDPQ